MTSLTGPCLGCMFFGTLVPEDRAYALLDHYVERGGRLLDTANNYAVWTDGGTGDESEELLGRWLAERGHRDELLIATKIGARPRPGGEGLSSVLGLGAGTVREQVIGSLTRLGVERVDLLYAHIDDAATPLAESVAAFDAVVREGLVAEVAASNYPLPRLREAHAISDREGLARFTAVQMRASYLAPAPDADFGRQVMLDDALARYAAAEGVTVFGYSALLSGAYSRSDRPLPPEYQHPGTAAQLTAVRTTADRLGIDVNQVVLGWLVSQGVVPVLGVSRIDQLDSALDAPELDAQALTELGAALGSADSRG